MNFIKIDKNPWLQYGAKVPLIDTKISTIEAAMNKFLKEHEILLNRVAFQWTDAEGVFNIVNNDNGALIARCTVQIVTPRV